MECRELETWIQTQDPLRFDAPPARLAAHLQACPACAERFRALSALRQEASRPIISPAESEKMWEAVSRGAEPRPAAPPPARWPWAAWLAPAALALGLVLLLLRPGGPPAPAGSGPLPRAGELANVPGAGAQPGSAPLSPAPAAPWAHLTGSRATARLAPGDARSIGRAPLPINQPTQVDLEADDSRLQIAFTTGGVIELAGRGDLLLHPTGFTVGQGRFSSVFRRGRTDFRIRVPQATLGIRGTTVRFNLGLGDDWIELVEGKVTVTPDGATATPFAWKPGERLAFRAGGWVKAAPDTVVATAAVLVEPVDATSGTVTGTEREPEPAEAIVDREPVPADTPVSSVSSDGFEAGNDGFPAASAPAAAGTGRDGFLVPPPRTPKDRTAGD